MRMFQNSGVYRSYMPYLDRLSAQATNFVERRRIFLSDRFGALHFLKPVLDEAPEAFFTNGDDDRLQRLWANENGLPVSASAEDILIAQIEHHRTEVFYNLDPIKYGSAFAEKLPGCVKKTVCWRAAPSGNADLSGYDLVVGNFPSILESWTQKNCRVALFYPAIDPVMKEYGHGERPIDVLFVGGYSRHHSQRAKVLESVAALAAKRNVVYCLDASRLTRLAEGPLRMFPPFGRFRRPAAVARLARPSVFGRGLYDLIGQSRIVLNGAVDMAGDDRGNMRCFEAMGCGAVLVSDAGKYPPAMNPGTSIEVYDSPMNAVETIERCLADPSGMASMAALGRRQVSETYSKSSQWSRFVDLVGQL